MLHWDFMLEKEASLRTWRLAQAPCPGRAIDATELDDHRLAYLDYEGPVSGNRGSVRRWDRGEFAWVGNAPDRIDVELRGAVLCGRAVIERVPGSGNWKFYFTPAGA